ncbi:MAG: 4-alpha-glucanotransferase [Elainellaceae cyanobacterium]
MPFPRTSGILLHPTSLPNRLGVGDLGVEAFRFIDVLHDCRQSIWQVLPLGPTGHGNSPYMSYSSMAGNPLLISLQRLHEAGQLTYEDISIPDISTSAVDYDTATQAKMPLLAKAADHFRAYAAGEQRQAFDQFCYAREFWLDGYALFMALKQAHGGKPWTQWEPAIARRDADAIAVWTEKLETEVFHQKYWQFEFHRQWSSLRQYANERGISILGDMPFYVAHDSADVWEFPDRFCLNRETGEPALMAGVPPDYFSATGQLWGNPIYDWERIKSLHFKWWIYRFEALLEFVDIIRIDHFRGFQAYWQVKEGETTAMNGQWVEAPGEELFDQLKQDIGFLPIIAEDLGVITPEVEALRDRYEFPGMKILQFAFGSGPDNPYLPFNYSQNCLVYTGTHDNDTTVGWFESADDYTKQSTTEYLGQLGPDGIHWDMIRLALSSAANQAIIPLQDLLGRGTSDRMNTPGLGEGNWTWRYHPDDITDEIRDRLRSLTQLYGRAQT